MDLLGTLDKHTVNTMIHIGTAVSLMFRTTIMKSSSNMTRDVQHTLYIQ